MRIVAPARRCRASSRFSLSKTAKFSSPISDFNCERTFGASALLMTMERYATVLVVAGSRTTIGAEFNSVAGSSDLARIDLAAPEPICRLSAEMISQVRLSLTDIENGRNWITDFIISNSSSGRDISHLRLPSTDAPPRHPIVGFRLRYMGGLQRSSESYQCGFPHTVLRQNLIHL